MTYWEKIEQCEHEGFEIVFSITPEEIPPDDVFDFTDQKEKEEFFRKLDQGVLLWFIARIQAFKEGVCLGEDYLGGCCYESMQDFKKDGYFLDMVFNAVTEAKNKIELLTEKVES